MMPRQNLLLPGLSLIESHFERRRTPPPLSTLLIFFLCQPVCLSIYLNNARGYGPGMAQTFIYSRRRGVDSLNTFFFFVKKFSSTTSENAKSCTQTTLERHTNWC